MKDQEINLFINVNSTKLLNGSSINDARLIETRFEKNNNKYISYSTYKTETKYIQVILTFKIISNRIILLSSKILFNEDDFESTFSKESSIMNYLKNNLDAFIISIPILQFIIQKGA